MRGMGAHKRREQVRSAQVSPLFMTPWVLYIEEGVGYSIHK